MSLSGREYLLHIRDELDYLAVASNGVSRAAFLDDATLKRAFVRSLEIVGEAARKVPAAVREHAPTIDWKAIAGMRDRLIHGYFGVDYELVWDVVTTKVPQLRQEIERLLRDVKSL